MADVEAAYKALPFIGPDGTRYNLRAVLVLPQHDRRAVLDAVRAVRDGAEDADAQETAINSALLAVCDDPEGFTAVLAALPLAAKIRLLEAWSEATQGPEA
ncbi:hypothetical protein ACIP5N_27725 [Streptomyces sp. NPDC088768]|uniref:hypothetical protein n=1 Tax=Streptomyces sp. NPDC088768 TaxID=3365894 RepID=UPI0037FC3DB6